MHTNHKLNFKNEFSFEVYCDVESQVEIQINKEQKFLETFQAKTLHKRSIEFYHDYTDGKVNKVEFLFSGEKEVSNKYLKINSLYVNSKKIDQLSYYYFPIIDEKWLTPENKNRIYVNNSGIFGWYGRIKYEVRTVLDGNSHYIAGQDPDYGLTRVLGFTNKNLVYQNNKNIRLDAPWLKKKL